MCRTYASRAERRARRTEPVTRPAPVSSSSRFFCNGMYFVLHNNLGLRKAQTFQYRRSTTLAAMMEATSPCNWLRENHSTATATCS